LSDLASPVWSASFIATSAAKVSWANHSALSVYVVCWSANWKPVFTPP
jgi:hypothetical protein